MEAVRRLGGNARLRVAAVVLVVGVVLPAAGVAFASRLAREAIHDRVAAGQLSTASGGRDQVIVAMDTRRRWVRAAATLPSARTALAGGDPATFAADVAAFGGALPTCRWALRWVSGAIAADAVDATMPRDRCSGALAASPIGDGTEEQVDAVVDGGAVALRVRTPIRVGSALVGSLEVDFSAQDLMRSFTSGTSGTLTIVDRTGRILGASTPSSQGQRLQAPEGLALAAAGRPAVATTYAPRLGVDVLLAYQPLEGTPFGVFASMPTAEAFADHRALQSKLLLGWVALVVASLAAGAFIGELVAGRDKALTQERHRLQRSEAQHRETLRALVEGVILYDVTGPRPRATLANDAAERILGHDVRGLAPDLDRHPGLLIDAAGRPLVAADVPVTVTARTGEPIDGQVVGVRCPDGGVTWFEASTSAICDDDGVVVSVVCGINDVTAARATKAALEEAHARFAAFIEHGTDLITLSDDAGNLVYASPAYEGILGTHPSSRIGQPMRDWVHPEDLEVATACVRAATATVGGVAHAEFRLQHADGSFRHVEATMANRLHDPAVAGIVTNTRDVTDRVVAARLLEHQARHDGLTGLPNRNLLLDRLHQALAVTGPSSAAVLFLDLDHFKSVNDGFGHAAGDELLVTIAERLRATVDPDDTVARIGGDEFVILVEQTADPDEVGLLAARLRDAVAAPLVVAGQTVTVACSIGISFAGDHGQPDTLLQEADTALYRAKDHGRNRWELYDQTMRTQARRRLEVEQLLRGALTGPGLHVAYQPIVDLQDRDDHGGSRPIGAEALLRLTDPAGRPIGPDEFIPVAEDSGLIVPIGLRVLRDASLVAASWMPDADGHLPTISVNLSAKQLASPDLVERVRKTLVAAHLPPERLCLELTETSLIDAGSCTRRALEDLAALGIHLALDDFGTGWSSLAYLRNFPISTLKIDRSFVAGLPGRGGDAEVVRAVIGLGEALGLDVIAEGVETEEQASILRDLGCSHAQGYLFGRPALSIPAFEWTQRESLYQRAIR